MIPSKLHGASASRRGAVLVCVMVVLLIVVLLSTQTIQTLLIVRRADRQRSGLRQARELVELGRMAVARDQVPDPGMMELSVDGERAVVRFEKISGKEKSGYRIVATLAVDTTSEVTATWESPK